jgi:uncharacterized protein YyaL (SSP411 family)
MIFALSEAGKSLKIKRYLDAARKAVDFIINNMWNGERLLHRYREGDAKVQGNLEDYAFLIKGLLSLYQTTGNKNDLKWAIHLAKILEEHFRMPHGAFYQTDGQDPHVIVRKSQFADGAEPSGNSIQGENLLTLYQITRDETWLKEAEDLFRVLNKHLGTYSPGFTYHVMNLLKFYDKTAPTFIISVGEDDNLEIILGRIYQNYLPHKTVIVNRSEEDDFQILPYLKDYPALDHKTTLYLCTQNHCKEPANDLNKILDIVDRA